MNRDRIPQALHVLAVLTTLALFAAVFIIGWRLTP